MNQPSIITTKRKRSTDTENVSRPPPCQPSSPGWLGAAHIPLTELEQGLRHPVGLGPDVSRSCQNSGNDRSVNVSASWTHDPITSVSIHKPPNEVSNKLARLQLSDQDSHLLSFDDAPPVSSGGSCELYIAVHRPTNLKLAMKRLRLNFPTDDMLRRFRREAEVWSTFRHPNILPFFGAMKIRHRMYIASPWMFLGDLLAFVQARINLSEQDGWKSDGLMLPAYRNFNEANMIQEIAAGLAHLHSIDVVHGDMKAKNVLMNDEGHAQICDFGLTKTLSHSVTSTELKGVGSTRWQSPELLQNAPKSAKSDVYAFGMTISEILTGNYPFHNLKEQTAVIFAVMLRNERPELQPHSFLGVDFEPLWRIAAKCWETKPEDRPQIGDVVRQLIPPPIRPILRLTRDILQSIFVLVANSRWAKTRLAITVSHVCRAWRLAATKLPSLWSNIEFDGNSPFNLQTLQIERSEGACITVRILGDYDTQETNQLIRLLRPHVTQWKSLEVGGSFGDRSYRLFFDELHDECAPLLEKLSVGHSGTIWKWESEPFSRGTPRLAHLDIGHYQLSGRAGLYNQLTNLYIGGGCVESCEVHSFGPWDLLAVFAQCASTIRSIKINIPTCVRLEQFTLDPNPLPQPISLPHLTNLELDLSGEESDKNFARCVRKIYQSITAPKLQSRDIYVCELEHLTFPIAFPFPNLSSLMIGPDYRSDNNPQVDIPQSVFIHVFSQLPQLRELQVWYRVYFDPGILQFTCGGLQKFDLRQNSSELWGSKSHLRMPERSVIKNTIERRQRRARRRGTDDPLVDVEIHGFWVSEEDYGWLKRHLESFTCLL